MKKKPTKQPQRTTVAIMVRVKPEFAAQCRARAEKMSLSLSSWTRLAMLAALERRT